MSNLFFEKPVLNFPYDYPWRHWELDDQGQPTQHLIEARREARINGDLYMAKDLKATGKGNLFDILDAGDLQNLDQVNGVDVFKPQNGEVVGDGPDGIACWFIDTDYNEESFFVRHAYFLGQNDPYKSLERNLQAEINEEAWASPNSATSRPFEKLTRGPFAVKAINHLGDQVMKVFRVS